MKKILGLVLAIFMAVCAVVPTFAAVQGFEHCSDIDDEALLQAAGCEVNEGDTVVKPIMKIINTGIGIAGIVCVGFIVYGGVLMVIAQGDPAKVAKGKNSVIYAVIGLVVAILAWAIVSFVSQAIKTDANGNGGTSLEAKNELVLG